MVVYSFLKSSFWKVDTRDGQFEILLALITHKGKGRLFRSSPMCESGNESSVRIETFRYVIGIMQRRAWESIKREQQASAHRMAKQRK